MRQTYRKGQGNKFNARKTVYKNKTFDSIMEKDYYVHLEELLAKGEIKSFEWQVPFTLQEGFRFYDMKREKEVAIRPIIYICDYVVEYNDGTTHLVDVKGVPMPVFVQKFKILKKILYDKGLTNYRVYCVKKLRNKWVIF